MIHPALHLTKFTAFGRILELRIPEALPPSVMSALKIAAFDCVSSTRRRRSPVNLALF